MILNAMIRTLLSLLLALQTPIMGTGSRKIFTANSQGPFTATVVTASWTNPNNAETCNGTFASTNILANANSSSMKLTGFGFSIPNLATISGITATIKHQAFSGNLKDQSVQLTKAGTPSGSDKANPSLWLTGSVETFSYGSSFDLWGQAWAPSDINNSGFGLNLVVHNTDSISRSAGIDCVTITVAYQ